MQSPEPVKHGSILYVTEFCEKDPNHTFMFDYISHYHMNSIKFYNIFLNFVWTEIILRNILGKIRII